MGNVAAKKKRTRALKIKPGIQQVRTELSRFQMKQMRNLGEGVTWDLGLLR
jgi:hypothetical protein